MTRQQMIDAMQARGFSGETGHASHLALHHPTLAFGPMNGPVPNSGPMVRVIDSPQVKQYVHF